MPQVEKRQKKEKKQDWSIEEWLEASIDRQKITQAKPVKTRKWDRKLKESAEIILSSPENGKYPSENGW